MALQLFDGSDSENDDISKIKINEEYARRFEHNKRREDLQRFEELKKKGVIDSPSPSVSGVDDESESESSDDEKLLDSRRSDKELFLALNMVKNKDPVLKQKDFKLFASNHSSEDESNDEEKSKSKDKKEKKPMYIKDVMAKHLIEDGPEFGDEEEETNGKEKGRSKSSKGKKEMSFDEADFMNKDGKKTYGDEQEELKRAFLEAVEKEGLEDGDCDFLTLKEKAGEDKVDSDDKEFEEKLDEYFGGDAESNENVSFLRSYFKNKMWIDKNGEKSNIVEEDLQGISEDDMEIERQEEYEYRFQENPGDRVLGHSRKVDGSVRKKTNTRKEQRKSKEERMGIAQKEREEELKHLKNLKKQEIQARVKKIMKTAGIHDDDIIPLSAAEIEEEFDPEEYDRMMKKAFDDKYYNQEDANPDFCSEDDDDMEKPDFEKEELKHLKNLKKQEIQERVKKIMKTAGIHDDDIIPLSAAEIEEEFDLEEYDRMMKKAFDEKYYNQEDANPDFYSEDDDDMEKPDFEKEDELLGLPKGWDACESDAGFLAAREKALKKKIENTSDDGDLTERENEKEKIPEEGSRKRKRKTVLLEKARQAMMDDYYKLDYEDTIGDLKTRFKYAKTKPNKFGMSASEILLMDDQELNQYVSLKKLAPYRDEEWKLSKQKKYMLKIRAKELLRAASLDKKKNKKSKVDSSKLTSSNSVVENEKANTEESNINMENLSRKARRRLHTVNLKLPQSRLKAYGKITSSKSKRGVPSKKKRLTVKACTKSHQMV